MKTALLIIVLITISATVFGQSIDEPPKITGATLGLLSFLNYHSILDGINLNNFRFGIGLDFLYGITDQIAAGIQGEIIFGQHKPNIFSDIADILYLDIPVTITGIYNMQGFFAQPYGGIIFNSASPLMDGNLPDSGIEFVTNVDIGCKLGIGGKSNLYFDIGYVIAETSYTHIGIGIRYGVF